MINFCIAISAEIELFKNDRILDPEWAKKFPGALWMPALAKALKLRNIRVTTGDMALKLVEQGLCDSKDIGIIQHLDDPVTEKLISLGAQPLVLTCFESPLYVPDFYTRVSDIASKFKHRVLFSGMFKNLSSGQGINHVMRFPSYDQEDIRTIVPWHNRHFLTMVVSNKYEASLSPMYLKTLPDNIKLLKRVVSLIVRHKNLKGLKSNLSLNANQLQDKRISAILFFGIKNCLKLYGKGWENLKNLPLFYRRQLNSILGNLKPELCENKLETIKEFKFALCFENFRYPGYVTEKIIECFVAGVIPIYIGAPNISEIIPSNTFIDVRDYETWEEMLVKLNTMTLDESSEIILNGRNFLSSEEGILHSYNGFSEFIEQLILKSNTTHQRT